MDLFSSFLASLQNGQRAHYFPPDLEPGEDGLVAIGGEMSVEVILEAYSKSIFPWTGEHPIPWFSPDPRMILLPQHFYASRSLKKLSRQSRYTVSFDHHFSAIIQACASPRVYEPKTWIKPNIIEVYSQLHALGIAHSVEVHEEDRLIGGLYGVSLGRAFFGESMFSWEPNGSKLALYRLCQALQERDFDFIDCQQETPHLKSLGATSIPRSEYLKRLEATLAKPSIHRSWSGWVQGPVSGVRTQTD